MLPSKKKVFWPIVFVHLVCSAFFAGGCEKQERATQAPTSGTSSERESQPPTQSTKTPTANTASKPEAEPPTHSTSPQVVKYVEESLAENDSHRSFTPRYARLQSDDLKRIFPKHEFFVVSFSFPEAIELPAPLAPANIFMLGTDGTLIHCNPESGIDDQVLTEQLGGDAWLLRGTMGEQIWQSSARGFVTTGFQEVDSPHLRGVVNDTAVLISTRDLAAAAARSWMLLTREIEFNSQVDFYLDSETWEVTKTPSGYSATVAVEAKAPLGSMGRYQINLEFENGKIASSGGIFSQKAPDEDP